MLECTCGDIDIDDYAWIYYNPSDFSTLNSKRRKRCSSCKKLIDIGSIVLEFERYRRAKDEIEERCKGDEVAIAPYYLCEKCGEIFFNLSDAGFCLDIENDMNEYMSEYLCMNRGD